VKICEVDQCIGVGRGGRGTPEIQNRSGFDGPHPDSNHYGTTSQGNKDHISIGLPSFAA
jgi:hypothetical protein